MRNSAACPAAFFICQGLHRIKFSTSAVHNSVEKQGFLRRKWLIRNCFYILHWVKCGIVQTRFHMLESEFLLLKIRLDKLLVERGLASFARTSSSAHSGGKSPGRRTKGHRRRALLPGEDVIRSTCSEKIRKYVSRGGLKLEKALVALEN